MLHNPEQAMESNICSYTPFFDRSDFKVSIKTMSVFVCVCVCVGGFNQIDACIKEMSIYMFNVVITNVWLISHAEVEEPS